MGTRRDTARTAPTGADRFGRAMPALAAAADRVRLRDPFARDRATDSPKRAGWPWARFVIRLHTPLRVWDGGLKVFAGQGPKWPPWLYAASDNARFPIPRPPGDRVRQLRAGKCLMPRH